MALLDERTLEQAKVESEKARAWLPLRPSSAGKCPKELSNAMLEYLGKSEYNPEIFKPNVSRLLKFGSYVEDHAIEQLGLLKPDYEVKYQQQELSFGVITSTVDPNISVALKGSMDFALVGQGKFIVVDCKSKKDWSARPFKTNWNETTFKLVGMKSVETISNQEFFVSDLPQFLIELDDPFYAYNITQVNMYAHSQFLLDLGVSEGAVLQYCKNDSQMRLLRFIPSQEIFKKTITSFQTALDAGVRGDSSTVPFGYEKSSVACRYCRFQTPCNRDRKNAEKVDK